VLVFLVHDEKFRFPERIVDVAKEFALYRDVAFGKLLMGGCPEFLYLCLVHKASLFKSSQLCQVDLAEGDVEGSEDLMLERNRSSIQGYLEDSLKFLLEHTSDLLLKRLLLAHSRLLLRVVCGQRKSRPYTRGGLIARV